MSQRRFPAVSTFTLQGKILVLLLRGLVFPLGLLFGRRPLPNFEENPGTYTAKEILYFAYKYYLQPVEKAENDALEAYFQHMSFSFPETAESSANITLSTGGDLMPYHWLTKESTRHLWEEIGSWYFDADLVYANLETPLHRKKELNAVPEVMLNNMHFNANDELFHIFSGNGAFKGYDVLSTANNHSFDMGKEGVQSTLEYLEEKGILPCGTARNALDQQRPRVVERNGIRIAFVSFTFCLNHLNLPENEPWWVNVSQLNLPNADLSSLKDQIKNAKAVSDFVVLALHNGNAYQAYPSQHTVENVHRIFEECGPDLILGSHPHNPQPLEQYAFTCPFTGKRKSGIAVYSQGDYIAYDIFTWCHLHLGLKFQLSRMGDEVKVTGMEVMPQYFWHGDAPSGFDFRLIPLAKCAEYESRMSDRSKKELAELQRFWDNFLAPSLSPYEWVAH